MLETIVFKSAFILSDGHVVSFGTYTSRIETGTDFFPITDNQKKIA